jgi:histidinol-phosphatase (PHP family)
MIPPDYHIHSDFSADGRAGIYEMCSSAAALGLSEIGFAEHYDLHPDENPRDWFRLEPWFEELERCRAEFRGRLEIRAGIEIGEPHLFQDETKAMLARAPFDYAIGSLHWVGRESIFDPSYFARPAWESFELYFTELARMTRLGGFDILGHLDVLIRSGYKYYGSYDPNLYEPLIREVLRNCIANGIALDVNTSALRRGAQVLLPGIDILRWYVEMGGMRVTLGSDAHRPGEIGAHFDIALDAILKAGLKAVVQFKFRRPRQMQLSELPA